MNTQCSYSITLICIEALQNQWGFRGFFLFCHHLHLEPRVLHCQLPTILVPIINRGYLFGLSTSSMALFWLAPGHEILGQYTKKAHFSESPLVFVYLTFLFIQLCHLGSCHCRLINSLWCMGMCPQ